MAPRASKAWWWCRRRWEQQGQGEGSRRIAVAIAVASSTTTTTTAPAPAAASASTTVGATTPASTAAAAAGADATTTAPPAPGAKTVRTGLKVVVQLAFSLFWRYAKMYGVRSALQARSRWLSQSDAALPLTARASAGNATTRCEYVCRALWIEPQLFVRCAALLCGVLVFSTGSLALYCLEAVVDSSVCARLWVMLRYGCVRGRASEPPDEDATNTARRHRHDRGVMCGWITRRTLKAHLPRSTVLRFVRCVCCRKALSLNVFPANTASLHPYCAFLAGSLRSDGVERCPG